MPEAGRDAFERMAQLGDGDAGALALGLRQRITAPSLRALAAEAVHVAFAAPERMADVYDRAAAAWLRGERLPEQRAAETPLSISPECWRILWSIAAPTHTAGRHPYAQQMMELAGELHPAINARMAAAALDFPGVAALGAEMSRAHDIEGLSQFPPASLGYALAQEILRPGSSATDPYWTAVLPYLRHMPAPLNYINVHVIQSMSLWSLVAGYTTRALDRVALGGFLMGQVGHHYSALSSAVTLTAAAFKRPANLEAVLDSLLRGWAHGRETRPLILVDWEPLWTHRVDQAREALGITPFISPYAKAGRAPGWSPRLV